VKLSERLGRTGAEPTVTAPPPRKAAAPATKPAARSAPAGAKVPPARPAADSPVPVLERRKGGRRAADAEPLPGLEGLRAKVRAAVVAELGPSLGAGVVDEARVRRLVEQHLDEASRSSRVTVGPTERADFLEQTLADMLGWGVLTPLMAEDGVTEIMVNSHTDVWVERAGVVSRTDVRFATAGAYRMVIDRMLAIAGRRVDEAQPMADGRLPDGSRVNVIIPPLVVGAPVLTIRRFPEIAFTVGDLVARGSLSSVAAEFLDLCIRGRLNVLVSGGTGTGKTTLLNVLSSSIPAHERIITIEDAAELRLGQPHVVALESRPANAEGAGAVSIRELVRNALRMRPDRIVVGEVRGGEALDMLQAMNTGHEGSLTTVHANTPRDALARLETMVLMSGLDLPLRAIREQITSAVDLVVQLRRENDGRRVISHVTEVQGREGDMITLQDVYLRSGQSLAATGLRPMCATRVGDRGLRMEPRLFRGTADPAARRRTR
jgi:pilus assembly protein CpaF